MSLKFRTAWAALTGILSGTIASAQPCYDWGTEFGLPDLDGGAYCGLRFDDGHGPAWFIGGQFVTAAGVTVNHIARFDGSAWSAMDGGVKIGGSTGVYALQVFDDGNGPALYAAGNFEKMGGQDIYSVARWTGSDWVGLGPGLNGTAYSLLAFDDGSGTSLYVCGKFSQTRDGQPLAKIAKWDGASWSALGNGLTGGADQYGARCMVAHDDGSGPALYVGGDFSTGGGPSGPYIGRWDGASWSAVGLPIMESNGNGVMTLAEFDEDGPGGSAPGLFAAGRFDRIGNTSGYLNVARWNGAAWSKVGGGLVGDQEHLPKAATLAVFDDNSGPALYVGGEFQFAGLVGAKNLARWDGSTWTKLGKGTDGAVTGLIELTENLGEPILGAFGGFSTAGGIRSPYFAEWTGLEWLGRGNSISMDGNGGGGYVSALAEFDDGNGPAVYAGGTFNYAGGLQTSGVARWDGSQWSNVAGGIPGSGVYTLKAGDGETPELFAGGNFAYSIARFDGSVWGAMEWGLTSPGGNSTGVWAIENGKGFGGGELFAGGAFRAGGGIDAFCLASTDTHSWKTYPGLHDETFKVISYDAGTGPALYVGGAPGLFGHDLYSGLVKWDGQEWAAVGGGIDGTVRCMAVFDDGSGPALFVAGYLGKDLGNGVVAHGVLRWDGSQWSDLHGGVANAGGPATVFDMQVFDDGTGPALYAVGNLDRGNAYSPEQVTLGGIGRWNGSAWQPVGPRFSQPVALALEISNVGGQAQLYAVGAFNSSTDGTTLNHVARWDGAAWRSLGTGLTGGNNVRANTLASFDDGTGPALYVAGDFDTAGGTPAARIAKWNGSNWSALGEGLSNEQNSTVAGMTVFDDGAGPLLYVSGSFHTAGGVEVVGSAIWSGTEWRIGPGVGGRVNNIEAVDVGNGPELFIEGSFGSVGQRPMLNVARWAADRWWPLGAGTNGDVLSLMLYDDGTGTALYAGGFFSHTGGLSAGRLARWGPCAGFIEQGCYADFSGDGSLDLFDFLGYVNAFNAQDPSADCDADGSFSLFDFLCFVNAFNAGC
jgi:hypothetical protein